MHIIRVWSDLLVARCFYIKCWKCGTCPVSNCSIFCQIFGKIYVYFNQMRLYFGEQYLVNLRMGTNDSYTCRGEYRIMLGAGGGRFSDNLNFFNIRPKIGHFQEDFTIKSNNPPPLVFRGGGNFLKLPSLNRSGGTFGGRDIPS